MRVTTSNLTKTPSSEASAHVTDLQKKWTEIREWFPTEYQETAQKCFSTFLHSVTSTVKRFYAFISLLDNVGMSFKANFSTSFQQDGENRCCNLDIVNPSTNFKAHISLTQGSLEQKLEQLVIQHTTSVSVEDALYKYRKDCDRDSYLFKWGSETICFESGDKIPKEYKLDTATTVFTNDFQKRMCYYLGMQGFIGDFCYVIDSEPQESFHKDLNRQYRFNLLDSGVIYFEFERYTKLDEKRALENPEHRQPKYQTIQYHSVFLISQDNLYCLHASITKTPISTSHERPKPTGSHCIVM
ncbi:hypothetical protein L2734_16915 [Parashewanella spongiae]|nr:hypothetical protein [Parashewanella spongiae]MCL1079820.1 hypothetical protein [Parashewanella spongiae]